jgi:tRNA(Leu) C34 or U34 (ribose-2'-O)-methylase TrmL
VMHLIAGPIFELTGKLLEKSGVDYIPLAPRKQDESYENLLDMLYKKREALEQSLDEPDDEDEQPEMMQEEVVSEPNDSVMDQEPVEEEVSAPSSGLMGRPE